MESDGVVDLEHVVVMPASQHVDPPPQTSVQTRNDELKKRRQTIFTRVLIVAVVLMVVSLGSTAFGVYLLLGRNDVLPPVMVLCASGTIFILCICQVGIYIEGKKSSGENMTSTFNCCRILSVVWFSFTLCATFCAVFYPILHIVLSRRDPDSEIFVYYIVLVVGLVMTILSCCMICPICCCTKVYGYTRVRLQYVEVRSRRDLEEEQRREESMTRVNTDTEQRSGPRPSAPPLDDLHYSDQRRSNQRPPSHYHDRDEYELSEPQERGYHDERHYRDTSDHAHRRGRGRGRRRGRGRPRGGHDRREESGATNEDNRETERGRGRSRGRPERRRRRHENIDRKTEHEEMFDDEPPSYNEVMEQLANEN